MADFTAFEDFDTEDLPDEVRTLPGKYYGKITSMGISEGTDTFKNPRVSFSIAYENNGDATASDGKTPVDSCMPEFCNLTLPVASDTTETFSSGKTKEVIYLSFLKEGFKRLGEPQISGARLSELCESQELCGRAVSFEIRLSKGANGVEYRNCIKVTLLKD